MGYKGDSYMDSEHDGSVKQPEVLPVIHSSNPQHEPLKNDPTMEALRDRTVKLDFSQLGGETYPEAIPVERVDPLVRTYTNVKWFIVTAWFIMCDLMCFVMTLGLTDRDKEIIKNLNWKKEWQQIKLNARCEWEFIKLSPLAMIGLVFVAGMMYYEEGGLKELLKGFPSDWRKLKDFFRERKELA